MFKLDFADRTPIYEQLKAQVVKLSLLGAIKQGDQLPSVRGLAGSLGVNPNTVQKAYTELEKEGIVYTVTGKGVFLSAAAQAAAAVKKRMLEAVENAMAEAKLCGITKDEISAVAAKVYEREAIV